MITEPPHHPLLLMNSQVNLFTSCNSGPSCVAMCSFLTSSSPIFCLSWLVDDTIFQLCSSFLWCIWWYLLTVITVYIHAITVVTHATHVIATKILISLTSRLFLNALSPLSGSAFPQVQMLLVTILFSIFNSRTLVSLKTHLKTLKNVKPLVVATEDVLCKLGCVRLYTTVWFLTQHKLRDPSKTSFTSCPLALVKYYQIILSILF